MPLLLGSVQVSVADRRPAVAESPVGLGGIRGHVVEVASSEAAPLPLAFTARTWNLYWVLSDNPVIVWVMVMAPLLEIVVQFP